MVEGRGGGGANRSAAGRGSSERRSSAMEPYGMFALLLLLPLLFVVLAVYRWVQSRGPNPFAVDTRRPPAPLITDKAVRRTVLKAGTAIPVPPSPYRHPRTPVPVPPLPTAPQERPGTPILEMPRDPRASPGFSGCPAPILPKDAPEPPSPYIPPWCPQEVPLHTSRGAPSLRSPSKPRDPHSRCSPSPCHPITDDILGATPY